MKPTYCFCYLRTSSFSGWKTKSDTMKVKIKQHFIAWETWRLKITQIILVCLFPHQHQETFQFYLKLLHQNHNILTQVKVNICTTVHFQLIKSTFYISLHIPAPGNESTCKHAAAFQNITHHAADAGVCRPAVMWCAPTDHQTARFFFCTEQQHSTR